MSVCGEVNQIHLCEHARMITATGGWSFYGCTYAPYHGKWIAEINGCPCGKTPQNAPTIIPAEEVASDETMSKVL